MRHIQTILVITIRSQKTVPHSCSDYF